MLRIVMDSAGDMPPEWAVEYGVASIPLNIHFGEQTFLQGEEIGNADFYRLADESGVIPKTSQPSPQQFIAFYRRIADPGDTIVSIHITDKLSGTLASAKMAARELGEQYRIVPVDSACGSAGMGYMCREVRLMERTGASLDEILRQLEFIRRNVQIVLTLNTMEYARRSGRVKALQAALASLLNVKPIIMLQNGILELGDRVRTRHKALDYIIENMAQRMDGRAVNAAVVHAEDMQSGQALLERVRSALNCKELILTELSIGIAANLGPGTIGIIAYPVDEGK